MFDSSKPRGHRLWVTLLGVVLPVLMLFPATALGSPITLSQSDTQPSQPLEMIVPSGANASSEASSTVAAGPYRVYLPLIYRPPLSYRLGFGAISTPITAFPEIESLRAGWYVDWDVQVNPARPNGMEYVQVVRVHQKLTCPLYSANAHDRTLCPYAEPYDYIFRPDPTKLEAALRANPGSLWLIGNEMDRRDWFNGGQDEMLPETYAVAYHDLYLLIKGVDPTAQVAIGGIIQFTDVRREYLTRVWDAYLQKYGVTMPIDVWNVHNFILRESFSGHGAGIPPGITHEPARTYSDVQHVDLGVFDAQIRAFRQWMKERGQQNKPLIVSEYGVLYFHMDEVDTPQEVQAFMVGTFDYFLDTRDCALGYPADNCRLVQRWAWYSLEDTGSWTGFNPYGALFDERGKWITSTGERFRTYSLTNMPRLGR